jgi:thiol-disulfide isomerase/thioredoxin
MKNAALALSLLALAAAPQDEPKYPTLAIGSPAVDFDLPGVDGKNHALKEFASAKVLLVIFDTVHCPTSQAYQERIKQVVADYKEKGVAVVAISPSHPGAVRLDELGYTDLDDSFDSMKIRAKDKQINYPFLYDGEPNKVSVAYGPKATPHCFLFDAERKLRYTGRIDDSEKAEKVKVHDLRNALDAVLAGKEPPVTVTKPMGCSTKWPFKQDQVKKYNEKLTLEPLVVEPADGAAVRELRKNESGKVRLIHVWSAADASQIQGLSTMNHWYRRRNFAFATVAVAPAEKRDEILAALKKDFPPASNRNLLVAEKDAVREALDSGWDGALPYTLLVGAANEVLYRKTGAVDDLELKRTIVRNLKGDR